MNLFTHDATDEDKESKELLVIGQPMPSFYPIMLRGFKLLEKKNMESYLPILRDYAIAPSF